MILNLKNKKPFITFGLGLTLFSCSVGDDVTIYTNDLYNENEYYIDQNEQPEIVTLTYFIVVGSGFEYQEEYTKGGIHNNRPYYQLLGGSGDNSLILWDGTQWLIVQSATGIITDPYLMPPVAFNTNDTATPVFDNWIAVSGAFYPINTTINTSNQMITFPAVESKEIQINIVNKLTGKPIASNTIQLNALILFGNETILWGNNVITFNN